MKLGKIMIFVSDFAEAKRFYHNVLGLPVISETANRLEFAHAGVDFLAFKCENNAFENYSKTARSVFVFEVESIEKAFADLRAKDVIFLHSEPAENEFSRYAAFSDPFGNVHEIFERK